MVPPRLAASLRHLCSLGLPGEVAVPQFLEALGEAVPSDSHHFFWTDAGGNPINYFGSQAGVQEQLMVFLEQIDRVELHFDGKALPFKRMLAGGEVALVGQGADRNRFLNSFFFNEILRHVGGRHVLLAPVRSDAGVRAGLGLWRESEGAEFSTREKAAIGSVLPYLGYALGPAGGGSPGPLVEDDDCGIALLDRGGRLVRMDNRAGRLLFLAAHPKVDISLRRYSDDMARPVKEICRNLVAMFEGRPSPPPQFFHRNRWGTFGFRAHWLKPPFDNTEGIIAVKVSLHVPRRLRFWRSIHTLGLPPRQQEVCLLFAEGASLTQIAQRLNISRHTAIDHMRRIYERLDILPDREGLVERLMAPRNVDYVGLPAARFL